MLSINLLKVVMAKKMNYIFFKRLFDILFSIVILILLFPAMFLIWVALFFSGIKQPIYVQLRPGLNCKIFKIYKFRTMTDESGLDGLLLPDSERITKIGKFLRETSLDELPELWNVLKGEMSLVGPRPLLVDYLDVYSERQNRRHLVRPGITGLAQVRGRNNLTWRNKFSYDVFYVSKISFALDLLVLFKTVEVVFARSGISKEGHATTDYFNGRN